MENNAEIILWVLASFAALKSLATFANFVAEKTSNKTDDKVVLYLSKGLSAVGKIIDLFTANTRPKSK